MSFLSNIAWKKRAETCYSMPVFCRSTLTLRYHLQFHSALVFRNENHFFAMEFGISCIRKNARRFLKKCLGRTRSKKRKKGKTIELI